MAGKPVAASPRCWCLCWCLWPTGVPGAASRRPSVFRAPEGPAAREARHPHFVRRRASKPARALRSLRRPPHQWCLVCSWAAARPRAVRAASFARRVGSLSGQALPPPTGTAARSLCRPAISHVIPLQLVQILNLYRWNCNVFGRSRKMTVGNYVRLLLRWLSPSLLGPSTGHGRRSRAPPAPSTPVGLGR